MEKEVARASEDRGAPPGEVRDWGYRIESNHKGVIKMATASGRWDDPDDAAHDCMSEWLAETGQVNAPGVFCRAGLIGDMGGPTGYADGADW